MCLASPLNEFYKLVAPSCDSFCLLHRRLWFLHFTLEINRSLCHFFFPLPLCSNQTQGTENKKSISFLVGFRINRWLSPTRTMHACPLFFSSSPVKNIQCQGHSMLGNCSCRQTVESQAGFILITPHRCTIGLQIDEEIYRQHCSSEVAKRKVTWSK